MVLDQIYTRATTVAKICRSRLWTALDGFAEQLLQHGRTVEWKRHALWAHVDAFLSTYPARRRDRHDDTRAISLVALCAGFVASRSTWFP